MRIQNRNRLIAVLLAGVMSAALFTGCGQKEKAAVQEEYPPQEQSVESMQQSTLPSEAQESLSDIVVGVEGWSAFDENVTIKIPVYDRHIAGAPDVTNNYWTDWIQENFGDKYNITIEFVAINRTEVLADYALLAEKGELPTIFMEYDFPKLAQWAAQGYLAEFDFDEFMKVAPTYYQRMVDLGQLSYTGLDGKTYFALAQRPYYNTDYGFVTLYRKDWLEQIGYDAYPDNWADEKEMLLKLKTSGICRYPCGGKQISGSGVDRNYEYRTFPLDEENWACYGDYAIPALGDEANKKLLRRENEKYNLGLIEPNFDTIDEEAARRNFANGRTLYYQGYIAADLDWVNAFYEKNPDGRLAVKITKNIVDREGGTVPALRANNPFGMMVGFSSGADENQIKAAWMYMEWMTLDKNLFTMQWGIAGENYILAKNGTPTPVVNYTGKCMQGVGNNKDYWCITTETRTAGTIEDIVAASTPKNIPQDFTSEMIANYYGQLEAAEAGYAVSD
ncbi:MAG: extracellular solute-binding protein, partial [Lachnospiraceae bacterium]|nr:extracellular solute-binding protein [Lachnospiraceae bacterium]